MQIINQSEFCLYPQQIILFADSRILWPEKTWTTDREFSDQLEVFVTFEEQLYSYKMAVFWVTIFVLGVVRISNPTNG